ncbi:hypothetical protein BX070DRAFT_65878 [Coemansia spiralis]|nr:hypothetical protein BX070DRAFT_65878 [Coemansia spiralis]
MAVTFELFWLFALCAILSFAHGGLLPNNRLHARASSDDLFVTTYLSTINDGILVKDGQQTFCSVIPINSKYAFVAASCFETKGNKENNNMNYEVYLSGPGYKTPTLIDVTSIQLHKDYDENTFANNIGILTIDNSNSTPSTLSVGRPLNGLHLATLSTV